MISAAPFRDRVVHHALCNQIEPLFETHFIGDSFANRRGKGIHRAIIERLQGLRLCIYESQAQVLPVRCGIPWLGFVVYPGYRRVKGRKVVEARRRLGGRFDAWQRGEISFGERCQCPGLGQPCALCRQLGAAAAGIGKIPVVKKILPLRGGTGDKEERSGSR